MAASETTCGFLDVLPVELRLAIYGFAIAEDPIITIGTAQLVGDHADIVYRLYGAGRCPAPGVPHGHEPVITSRWEPSLLDQSASIQLTPTTLEPTEENSHFERVASTHQALLAVSTQVHDELAKHFAIAKHRRTSLFVQYPHGLPILQIQAPHLMHRARSIHLAGTSDGHSFVPSRPTVWKSRPTTAAGEPHGDSSVNTIEQLSTLVESIFGPSPRYHIEKIEMRVMFFGPESYPAVWTEESPVAVFLRNVHCGHVNLECWRGNLATGMYISARPVEKNERRISTTWRKLDEGSRMPRTFPQRPLPEDWLLDEDWPEWKSEPEQGTGAQAIVCSSVPAA